MKFLNIVLPFNVKNLSNKERTLFCLFYIFVPTIPLILLYLKYQDNVILLSSISIMIFMFFITFPIFLYEKWDEKYGIHSTIRLGSTYQFLAKYLPLFTPGLIALVLSLSYILNNLILGIFISFSFIIPSLIFFRTDIFNDKNCCVSNEIIFGYPTGKYSILSVLFGLIGFYSAYSVLNNTYNAIFLVIFTVIFQLILLFPDIVNKYLSVDIKLKKYFLLFILILILIFLILVFSFKGNLIFNLNVFSFIKLTFIIVLSLIISKWYLKKIK